MAYIDNRKKEYPPIGDQLDMQYWDKVNGTSTWQDAVAKVKSDNPKQLQPQNLYLLHNNVMNLFVLGKVNPR